MNIDASVQDEKHLIEMLRVYAAQQNGLLPPTLDASDVESGIKAPFEKEIKAKYGTSREARMKALQDVEFMMTHLDVGYRVNIASDSVDMEGFCRMDRDGNIMIQQVITNTSPAPLDAQAYVLVPGFPRAQRYIVGLLPNQTTIKRFTFSASEYTGEGKGITSAKLAELLTGASATLGVRENDGRTLITKSIPLE